MLVQIEENTLINYTHVQYLQLRVYSTESASTGMIQRYGKQLVFHLPGGLLPSTVEVGDLSEEMQREFLMGLSADLERSLKGGMHIYPLGRIEKFKAEYLAYTLTPAPDLAAVTIPRRWPYTDAARDASSFHRATGTNIFGRPFPLRDDDPVHPDPEGD